MRVALIGANGQLGADLQRALDGHVVTAFVHADFDVCDRVAAAAALENARPEVVINTSAYHRVDDCEDRAALAFEVNAVAVHGLARWCEQHGAIFVHFSTDYVFGNDLNRARSERDPAEPLSVYGASKLAGEWLARLGCARHYVIRTSGLYGRGGSSGKGGANFVELMLRLAGDEKGIRVVEDQVLTPTYTADLAPAVVELLGTGRFGLYHATSSGQCSWYGFAAKVFELAGVEADLSPTTAAAYGARAQRPACSVLENAALREAGMAPLPAWEDALGRYLRARGGGGAG